MRENLIEMVLPCQPIRADTYRGDGHSENRNTYDDALFTGTHSSPRRR